MKINSYVHLLLLLFLSSCTGFREQDENSISKKLNNIQVRDRDIFADIGVPNKETKSGELEPVSYLAELLDYAKCYRRWYNDGDVYIVYPFKSNEESIYYSLTKEEPRDGEVIPVDSLLCVKNFVVEQQFDGGDNLYVVTMLLSPQYFKEHDNMSSSDVLYMNDYTGYVVYAELNQSLCYIDRYENGEIFETIIDYDGALNGEYGYLCATKRVDTKLFMLDPAVCIADRNGNRLNWMLRPDIGDDGDNKDKTIIKEVGNEKIGGGYRTPDKRLKSYRVNVVSASPEKGTVTGGGEYAEGKMVKIKASEKETLPPEIPNVFKYWTGDFERYGKTVRVEMTQNYESVAYFDKIDGDLERPCVDTLKGIGNIFNDMSIASSGVSGYRGGTYGMTRVENNKRKMHKGIDIYAEVGTPVHSPVNGKIRLIRDNCSDSVKDSNRSLGNWVAIEYNDRLLFFCHLQGGGKTMGYNYRASRNFKEGDIVYCGDIIAYSGQSGNAVGVENPHVHFEVRDLSASQWYDPTQYLNGRVDYSNGNVVGVKCDELITNLVYDYEEVL